MTNEKLYSESVAAFVNKAAIQYLRVLKTQGLRALINLVMQDGHMYELWYNSGLTPYDLADGCILKCDAADLCRKAMDSVLGRAVHHCNEEYYVDIAGISDGVFEPLLIKDDEGKVHPVDEVINVLEESVKLSMFKIQNSEKNSDITGFDA